VRDPIRLSPSKLSCIVVFFRGVKRIRSLTLAVCITVIAALVVGASGCTSTSNNTASTATTHDPLLEKFINATQQQLNTNSSDKVLAWYVTWNNDTNVTALYTFKSGTNTTIAVNQTVLSFATTQDATNFLNAFNKANYILVSTNYTTSETTSGIYYNATGHTPAVYMSYAYSGGGYLYELAQADNIIEMSAATFAS